MNKSILVAALLAVALTACGKKEEPKVAAPAPAPAAAAPAPAPAPAAPQAGMAGMEAAKTDTVVAKEQQGGMAGMEAKK